jgi:hypothetical protein
MKSVTVILGGAVCLVALSSCGHRDEPLVLDNRTQSQKAEACIQQFEPEGKAPQVMTYDSETKTEVHLNTEGKIVTLTAQNKPDETAMGVEGKVGGARPKTCTDASVSRGESEPKRKESRRNPFRF